MTLEPAVQVRHNVLMTLMLAVDSCVLHEWCMLSAYIDVKKTFMLTDLLLTCTPGSTKKSLAHFRHCSRNHMTLSEKMQFLCLSVLHGSAEALFR